MKNNKVILSVVLSSIAAVTAAPTVFAKSIDLNLSSAIGDKKIDMAEIKNFELSLSQEEKLFYNLIGDQVGEQLTKKSSAIEISRNINSILNGYENSNMNLREEVLSELFANRQFAQLIPGNNRDSTSIQGLAPVVNAGVPITVTGCHSACHWACYGNRGFR